MNIRSKLLVGGAAIALVSILLASYVIGQAALNAAGTSLTTAAQDRLVALREARKTQIEDYFNSLVIEGQSFSRSNTVADALRVFRQSLANIVKESGGDGKITTQRATLSDFYTKDFATEYTQRNSGTAPYFGDAAEKLDATSVALQTPYIAANPNPLGQKDKLAAAPDNTAYSRAHAQYHANISALQKRIGLNDMLLVDADSRRVVYSVAKNLDFGVTLDALLLTNSKLVEVVQKAFAAKSADEVFVSDFVDYAAGGGETAGFIAIPLFDKDVLQGAVVLNVPVTRINAIMTGDRKWVNSGLGKTGQSFLVGADKLARSEIRFLLENKENWLKSNQESFGAERVAAMRKKNTAVGVLSVATEAVNSALAGESGVMSYKGLRNEQVGAFAPFRFKGLNWALIVNQDRDEVFAAAEDLRSSILKTGVITSLLLAALVSALIYWFVSRFMKPITKLQSTVAKVSAGDFSARAELKTGDEMQALGGALDNLLNERINAAKKAEQENEQINNSVIGLLTTVAELSQKNLTARAPVTEDIIGTVGDSINQMTDATVGVLRDVTKIAGLVEHASKRVKQQSDAVNTVAASERMSVNRLVQSLKQATDSMQQVSQLAQNSNKVATEASANTAQAMSTVDTTVKGMDGIREAISEMEKRIKRLGERSQEISQIVNLINTISERTHVLSLNASMQAAMAGEAGRGFAVVAEEVQRLAENSRQATGQISTLVQNIQIETNDTIGTVNRTIDQVVQGSDLARNSGVKMRETQNSTARLVEMVQSIARSAQAQMKLAADLQAAAGEITASTQETAQQLTQQNQVTASLLTASQKLVESVSVFKLPKAKQ